MDLPPLKIDESVKEYLLSTLSAFEKSDSDINDLLTALSRPPAFTTLRINTRLKSREHLHAEVKDTLSQQYNERGWSSCDVSIHPDIPDVVIIQNYWQNPAPVCDEVIVDASCGTSVLRGADVFQQGILAAPPGMKAGQKVSVYADLDSGCRRGLTKSYNGQKVFVGNGISKVSREEVFCGDVRKLSGVGIQMTEPLLRAPSLDHFLPDRVFAQNLPSIVCSHVLDPQPGDSVLDMCAAPGGKTCHLATLMNNKGRLVALDKSKNKIRRIQENCDAWNLSCVEAYHFDGTRSVDNDSDTKGAPPFPQGSFDRILLDAPCSALGQRPALHNKSSLSEVSSYPPLQKKLFSQAVQLLKPGGTLVYSTCTVPCEENEALVFWALGRHPDIQLARQKPHVGGHGWPCSGLSDEQASLLQRFDPRDVKMNSSCDAPDALTLCNKDTIGFFIAKFIKVVPDDR